MDGPMDTSIWPALTWHWCKTYSRAWGTIPPLYEHECVLRLLYGTFFHPHPFTTAICICMWSRSQSCLFTGLRWWSLNCGYVPHLCQHAGIVCRPLKAPHRITLHRPQSTLRLLSCSHCVLTKHHFYHHWFISVSIHILCYHLYIQQRNGTNVRVKWWEK